MQNNIGIRGIGLAIPSYALPLSELAKIRSVNEDANNYMALCTANEDVVTLATLAAKRALKNSKIETTDLGLLIVGSETSVDMSRPLSSWVMQELNIFGNIRSYEVKHACFGATAAIRQALEWQLSGNARGKFALVIAADVAQYEHMHSGEPTQGAGAVAFIIGPSRIATIDPISYAWSSPQFDFWRPIDCAYPKVNAKLSLSCYLDATLNCFKQIGDIEAIRQYIDESKYLCFHVPFPKMVFKAFKTLGLYCRYDINQINELYNKKVTPTMQWNLQIGNSYTASLWFAVCYTLSKLQAGDKIGAFSYGSGCGAELLSLQCTDQQANAVWYNELVNDFKKRKIIDVEQYLQLRNITKVKEFS